MQGIDAGRFVNLHKKVPLKELKATTRTFTITWGLSISTHLLSPVQKLSGGDMKLQAYLGSFFYDVQHGAANRACLKIRYPQIWCISSLPHKVAMQLGKSLVYIHHFCQTQLTYPWLYIRLYYIWIYPIWLYTAIIINYGQLRPICCINRSQLWSKQQSWAQRLLVTNRWGSIVLLASCHLTQKNAGSWERNRKKSPVTNVGYPWIPCFSLLHSYHSAKTAG